MSKGGRAKPRQERRACKSLLAWAHLRFYPFQGQGLARVDQRPPCCVHPNGMSGHRPSSCPLIAAGEHPTLGRTRPGESSLRQSWVQSAPPAQVLSHTLCPHPHSRFHPQLSPPCLVPTVCTQTCDCVHPILVTYRYRYFKKKQGMMVHTCNTCFWGAEEGS